MRRKKSVDFKAQDGKNEEESGCQEEESDEKMALFVKRFNRMMTTKTLAREDNHQGKILLLTRHAFNVVKWATPS